MINVHNYSNFDVRSETYNDGEPIKILNAKSNEDGVDIDMATYFNGWYTQPLTMVFRVSMADMAIRNKYRYFRDMHEIYYLLKAGKCRLMAFYGGVHIMHSGGIASMISREQFCRVSLPIDREFYWKTLDKGAKKQYLDTLSECVKVYSEGTAKDRLKALSSALKYFILTGHLSSIIRNFKVIFGKKK